MIRAAGGVLWRDGPQGREVAVVHRPRYDDWSLPKGKLEPGEAHLVAALREVREETGFSATPASSLGTSSYVVGGEAKTVRWWSMRAGGGSFAPSAEVDELHWLDPPTALALLGDGTPLHRWLSLPAEAAVILLVRHGSAGDAAQWQNDDDRRPLDATGRAQAAHIASVLSHYRPARILSAPPLRCQDTIAPLAAAVGLSVELDPQVGESGAPSAPQLHVLSCALPGSTTVICSQGGVIPRVVQALVPERAPARARKGSVWSLTVADGVALVADDETLT